MKLYGLIGFPLEHSFSRSFFLEKFAKDNIKDADYRNFPIENIDEIIDLIKTEKIYGLSVTIPYKEKIINYLHSIDNIAKEIGAVNTIKIYNKNNKPILKGFNTDVYGFEESIKNEICKHKFALILGTGGAAKAAAYVMKKHSIIYNFVSRIPKNENEISYEQINEGVINKYSLIINTSPVGMYPNIQIMPNIPYQYLNANHFLFDMVYNPLETVFLAKARLMGCKCSNGLEMLYAQANKSWEIWSNNEI